MEAWAPQIAINNGADDKPVDGMGNDQNAQNPFFVTNQSHRGSVWFGMVHDIYSSFYLVGGLEHLD